MADDFTSQLSLQVALSGKKSPIIDPPHHIQYFSPSSLSRLVSNQRFAVERRETVFWDAGSDIYLNMMGVPMTLARAIRYAMFLPAMLVERMDIGGAVSIIAQRID